MASVYTVVPHTPAQAPAQAGAEGAKAKFVEEPVKVKVYVDPAAAGRPLLERVRGVEAVTTLTIELGEGGGTVKETYREVRELPEGVRSFDEVAEAMRGVVTEVTRKVHEAKHEWLVFLEKVNQAAAEMGVKVEVACYTHG